MIRTGRRSKSPEATAPRERTVLSLSIASPPAATLMPSGRHRFSSPVSAAYRTVSQRSLSTTATVFDPSSGAIVSFDYSFHGMAVPGNVGNGHGVSIAARQAGNIFFGQSFAVHGINNTAWNSYSGAGVTANDFSCFLCSATLELTTSGAPIELGFVHASSTQQSIRVFRTIGMDNVLLRSNLAGAPPASPATSPPTAALMLLGLVATVRFRRGRVARAHRRAGAATTSHERRTIE